MQFLRRLSQSMTRGQRWGDYAIAGLLVGLLVLFALLDVFVSNEAVDAWLQEYYLAVVLSGLALLITGGAALLLTLSKISDDVAQRPFPHLRQMISRLNHGERIAAVELQHAVHRLEHFFDTGILILHGRRAFQEFWIRALHRYAGSHIVATSLPSKQFFWNTDDEEIHGAVRANVAAGGTTTRIFLLSGPTPAEEELRVMRKHQELGVKVHYCDKNNVPHELRDLALADTQLRFGWKTTVTADDLREAQICTRKEHIEALRDNILLLLARTDIVKELTPA